MEDQTLKNLWQKARMQGEDYYQEHKSEILEKAQRNSQTIFDKIHRTMKWEFIFSLIVCLAIFPFLFTSSLLFFGLFFLLMLIAVGLSWKAFQNYQANLSVIRSGSILESLKEKSVVLKNYIARIKKLTYILMPPSFFLGFFFSIYQEGEINWVAIGIASILIIPALWGLFWFTKKYLHLLYGRHLHKLEEMIDHLEND
jgi:hypothetical protein